MKSRNSPQTRGPVVVALLCLLPAAAAARDRQFSAVVHRLEAHYQKKPVHFMGLASFIANRARPEGVRNLQLAVFEGLDASRQPTDIEMDPFMQEVAGPEFHLFVRVHSRRDRELTYIYARETGKGFELLIVALEQDDASVVKMQLDPEAMGEWFDAPTEKAKDASYDP
jgi:hypothetical protein